MLPPLLPSLPSSTPPSPPPPPPLHPFLPTFVLSYEWVACLYGCLTHSLCFVAFACFYGCLTDDLCFAVWMGCLFVRLLDSCFVLFRVCLFLRFFDWRFVFCRVYRVVGGCTSVRVSLQTGRPVTVGIKIPSRTHAYSSSWSLIIMSARHPRTLSLTSSSSSLSSSVVSCP